MREFDKWFNTFTKSIYTYDFFTDFDKVYSNINKIKIELNILNSLIGCENIEEDFKYIISKYPDTLKCIPILLAIRQTELIINDTQGENIINFNSFYENSIDIYIKFMRETGLFDLLATSQIKSLIDYIIGVEVGLDSNARKNRTGTVMENLVESYIKQSNFKYYTQVNTTYINNNFNIDLSTIIKNVEKRIDFVITKNNHIYAIEVNFYNRGGSKLNETARSYKEIVTETKNIENFTFIWITDGAGWKSAKNNLRETFATIQHLYNINDLKNNILQKIIK